MQPDRFRFPFRPVLLSLGLALAALQAGCAHNPFAAQPTASQSGDVKTVVEQPRLFGLLSPYRPTVQQGNFISQEMVSQLKVGMTPEQVRFLLGTPLLTDVFHANRWDYPFRLQKGNGEVTVSHVTVVFEEKRVARIEGADLPNEKDYLMRIAAPKTN